MSILKLKLSTDTILAVNQLLKEVYSAQISNDPQLRIVKSISYDISDKFDAKTKSLVKKASLFDQKKKHSISLKYHEAYALQYILIDLKPSLHNEYKETLIQSLILTINQKLA